MKNVLFACICFAAFGIAGCGDDCADLADEMRDCCADYPAGAAQDTCNAVADAVEEDGEDCEPDEFECTAPTE